MEENWESRGLGFAGCEKMLADNETCQACGECCKQYWWVERDPDVAFRFVNLKGVKVWVEERQANNQTFWLVTIDHPCKWLKEKDGKFYCDIYSQRPDMCEAFPDNVPLSYFEALQDKCPVMEKTLERLK